MNKLAIVNNPPSFLDNYDLSMLYFGRKILCIVINFIILWFLCRDSAFVNFKNSLLYLTSGTDQVLLPLMRFPLQSLVLRRFFPLSRAFFFFTFSPLVLWYLISIFANTCKVLLFFLDLVVQFLLLFVVFHFLL